MKKTMIIGASPNPSRYSYIATKRLSDYGHDVFPLGIRKGEIAGNSIILDRPRLSDIHTITLYLNKENQKEWYDYILSLRPKRLIFNPGAENEELARIASENGIQAENACTLVLLSSNQYE